MMKIMTPATTRMETGHRRRRKISRQKTMSVATILVGFVGVFLFTRVFRQVEKTIISSKGDVEGISNPHRTPLVAHLVPHSHCDAAYKKTVDEYYETEVRTVLNSMVHALEQQSSRRFVWSETVFLWRWWKDPRTRRHQKETFQKLLNSGQLELVNGGYIMHDEAITRYDSQIDQMTRGHDLLREMFVDERNVPNVSITTGWQIDPFGAASFTVNLYNWSGMDILVTNRFPKAIKEELRMNKSLEFVWQVPGASILVHVFDTHYESPHGFDWESFEHPSIPVDDSNIQNMSDTFVSILRQKSAYYQTEQLLIPLGGDFRFQNASLQFKNMERIVEYINSNPERYGGDRVQFSTVREYKANFLESMSVDQKSIPVLSGSDFLPFWGGYYTQTPIVKQMVRTVETLLRHCRAQLFKSFASGDYSGRWEWFDAVSSRIRSVADTVHLMQHHDALPVTSYKFVVYDYMTRLRTAFLGASDIILEILKDSDELSTLSKKDYAQRGIVGGGPYLSETVLVRDSDDARSVHLEKVLDPQMGMLGISLMVLNSMNTFIETIVHVVATRPDVAVLMNAGDATHAVMSQATPLEHELDSANLGLFLISFKVNLTAFESRVYQMEVCDLTWDTMQPPPRNPPKSCAVEARKLNATDLIQNGISSDTLHLHFDSQTNDIDSLSYLCTHGSNRAVSLNHDIVIYDGTNDTVYSMKTPVELSDPTPLLGSRQRKLVAAYSGPLFSEVTLKLTEWLSVRYRITNGVSPMMDSMLQVSMLSGVVPYHSNVATRFVTNLTKTHWMYEESSFHDLRLKYDSSQSAGDGNIRPLTSWSWIETETPEKVSSFGVFSVDPRGVLAHRSGELDVFWKRRNDKSKHRWWDKKNSSTGDWWKQGDDKSVSRSSLWLSLGDDSGANTNVREDVKDTLTNDVVVIDASGTSPCSKAIKAQDLCLPTGIRLVSSDFYIPEKKSSKQEGWLSLQLENYLQESDVIVDLFAAFHDIPNLLLGAAKASTLTFLNERQDQSNTGPCRLEFVNGGRKINLSLKHRMICSLRIPLVPTTSFSVK